MRTVTTQYSMFGPIGTKLPSMEASFPEFDGATYDQARDGKRLGSQMEAVLNLMKDGDAWALKSLAAATGYPEASISARLRDLRKPRFGGHTITREYIERGLWLYRLVAQQEEAV